MAKTATYYLHKAQRLDWDEHLTPYEIKKWAELMFEEYADPNNTMYVSDKPMSFEDCEQEVAGELEWICAMHNMQKDD